MRDPVSKTRLRRKSKKAVYLVNNLLPNGVPRYAYNVQTFHAMRSKGAPMRSPMTRAPITKGWKRVLNNSELPLGTERARLRTYMKNKMKLTAAQKANYIKRLNNGESFNKIINTINRTTVPKTNFKSKPPFSNLIEGTTFMPIGNYQPNGKTMRAYIMQELADLEKRISTNVPKNYQAPTRELLKSAVIFFMEQYRQAERDLVSFERYMSVPIKAQHNALSSKQLNEEIKKVSPSYRERRTAPGISRVGGETLEKVAKAGMGIIFRKFSNLKAFSHWGDLFLVQRSHFFKKDLVQSRQKIIVAAMMRMMRLSFSQLNKKVQILMKNRRGKPLYRDSNVDMGEDDIIRHGAVGFAKKYLLPLTRAHKAAKTIQKVVRGGQVRNKIRKNANNLRKKVNRAEKLRSVVQASKKRKTPTPTPASSTRIKK